MEHVIELILEKGWIALAISLVILVVLWRRYVKLEEGAMAMVKKAHTREVEIAIKSAAVAKEILPVLRAVDERGERLENRLEKLDDEIGDLDRFADGQKRALDEISKLGKRIE